MKAHEHFERVQTVRVGNSRVHRHIDGVEKLQEGYVRKCER